MQKIKKPYNKPEISIVNEVTVLENAQQGVIVKLLCNPSGLSLDIVAPNEETKSKLYEGYKYLLRND